MNPFFYMQAVILAGFLLLTVSYARDQLKGRTPPWSIFWILMIAFLADVITNMVKTYAGH